MSASSKRPRAACRAADCGCPRCDEQREPGTRGSILAPGSFLDRIDVVRNHAIRTCIHPAIRTVFGASVLVLALASFAAAGAENVTPQDTGSVDQLPPDQEVADTVIELAGWIVASKDSQGYSFAIIDKAAAQILVFGGDGRLRGAAPGLFGSAVGDHTAPGIAGLALREIPGRDRTTPAGRFIGGFGPSIDAGRVLWVDHESAVSIHPTATGVPAERRAERLASPSPDDNRITHGCINVTPDFYERVMQPTFERGGVFYVLPDKASLADTFPEFAKSRTTTERTDRNRAKASRD